MDIKERLRSLESLPLSRQRIGIDRQPPAVNDIHQVLDGETIVTEVGTFFRAQRQYSGSALHGTVPVSALLGKDSSVLTILENNPALAQLDLRRTLFIDTETTGLSGGLGTCAFLIGIGYFQESSFQIDQYLMNDFNEELAMLQHISTFVQDYQAIVTYNGKSFDIPLLNSRHIYAGLRPPFEGMHHIDLLHCVRRLWNHKLENCILTTAEFQLVSAAREGDVPGYLIPYTYFDYLRSRNPDPLKPVLYHNEKDILTMVTLLNKAIEVVEKPMELCTRSADLVRVGKLFEVAGRHDHAIHLYETHLTKNRDPASADQSELLFRLGFAYKTQGRRREAAAIWEKCISEQRYHPLPYIELAKHHEHSTRDLVRAKRLVDTALTELNSAEQVTAIADSSKHRDDLIYRRDRLARKLQRC